MDFWEKTNGTFGVLDIFTKHLCEKKMNVFWVYMLFNIVSNGKTSVETGPSAQGTYHLHLE